MLLFTRILNHRSAFKNDTESNRDSIASWLPPTEHQSGRNGHGDAVR
jgi:hypothetical protein